MIDFKAFHKITYGLYIVCSGNSESGNGYISNTVFQVTSEPAQFAVCCNKDNYTSEFIEKYNNFSVSILHENSTKEIFGRFGYKSGKDFNKLEGMDVKYGETGVPIVRDESIAYLECKVIKQIDLGTHLMFIGELIDAQVLAENNEPITYAFYRTVKNGITPKNAPSYIDKSKLEAKPEVKQSVKYECTVCGYIHDEDEEGVKFADLPDDWKCPVCGADKEDFNKI